MTYLEQLATKVYTLDLSSIKEEEKAKIKASVTEEKTKAHPVKLSKESEQFLEAAINDLVSKT